MPVVSPFIWQPAGSTTFYDLRKVYAVTYPQPNPDSRALVRFRQVGAAAPIVVSVDKDGFEAAYAAYLVPADPPANLTEPVVTGTGYIGYELTTTDGTWSNSPTSFSYQWQRWNGVTWDNIGADQNTYTVVLADEGAPVRCLVTATNGSGSSAPEASNEIEQWVPTDMGVFLRHWWDAQDPSTITTATGVSMWADKGQIGTNVSQITGVNQPTQSAAWGSGLNALAFDGNQNLFAENSPTFRDVPDTFIAAGARAIIAGSVRAIAGVTTPNSGSMRAGLRVSPSNNLALGGRRLDADVFQDRSFGAVSDSNSIFMGVFEYGSAQVRGSVNGTMAAPQAFQTAGNTSDTDAARLGVGAFNQSVQRWEGLIAEVIFSAGNITDDLKNRVDGYLAWRLRTVDALDAGSPYKTAAPTP